jgi:hypothetical protein
MVFNSTATASGQKNAKSINLVLIIMEKWFLIFLHFFNEWRAVIFFMNGELLFDNNLEILSFDIIWIAFAGYLFPFIVEG